jgi:hypothetical protein
MVVAGVMVVMVGVAVVVVAVVVVVVVGAGVRGVVVVVGVDVVTGSSYALFFRVWIIVLSLLLTYTFWKVQKQIPLCGQVVCIGGEGQ